MMRTRAHSVFELEMKYINDDLNAEELNESHESDDTFEYELSNPTKRRRRRDSDGNPIILPESKSLPKIPTGLDGNPQIDIFEDSLMIRNLEDKSDENLTEGENGKLDKRIRKSIISKSHKSIMLEELGPDQHSKKKKKTKSKAKYLKDLISKYRKSRKQKFGWFLGVFIPVFLNMICVTYFMDLNRTIQHIGWGLSTLYFLISITISIGTLISICVIATNGEMKEGGCYYLISRTLGPEIGGPLGLILVVGHASALSHRLHYLSSTITNFYTEPLTTSMRWDQTLWHIVLSLMVLFSCIPGFKFITYFLVALMLILIPGVVSIYAGFFVRKPGQPSFFTRISLETLTLNFEPQANIGTFDIAKYIGILFPSTNAVMTCANFSGNLRNSRRDIPVGAFTAIFLGALIIYSTMILQSSSFGSQEMNKDDEVDFSSFEASALPILSYISFIAVCFGSAITLSTGGARVFAKMIEDHLVPQQFKRFFFRGEPLGCNVVVAIIGIIFALVDKPTMSTEITNIIFLIPFALINFAVYTAASAHYPGFRPAFKFYNKWISLFLALICILRMFLVNWIVTLVCLPLYIIIWFIYHKIQPADNWGTVTQSKFFYLTLKEELNLYHYKPHVKTFRPNIIFITTAHPDEIKIDVDFLNLLLHGHGMAAIGRVILSDANNNNNNNNMDLSPEYDFNSLVIERDGTYLTLKKNYRTFYDVTVSKTFAKGVRDLLLLMGIGRMRPNTICIKFPERWHEIDDEDHDINYHDFYNGIETAFDANFSLTVVRNIHLFQDADKRGIIDVWWIIDDGGLTLLLAYLLHHQQSWKNSKLRVITLAHTNEGNDYEKQHNKIATLLYKFRIVAEITVIEVDFETANPSPMSQTKWNKLQQKLNIEMDEIIESRTKKYLILTDLLRGYSSSSSFVIFTMAVPMQSHNSEAYLAWLEMLSDLHVPFLFVRGNGESTLSWTV
ncbi:Amino acid permease family protein [Tritrichomonas foetus]|uniref:Amino acid permease family protein n=1 Tax=Tritrichomonas foetus TaxID=1144522 RepID=A0A1J4KYC6_9EUKA|nr:Amino acid permease family protein [Tritrichomonas foetus]|eukprot:OHT16257.1 Amino acid permease family protein [Tritrichomonas foetus]